MAHPKRRHSKSRGAKRRTHYKLESPRLFACKQCGKNKPGHMVCPYCGYYAGKEVVQIELKEKTRKKGK